MPHNRLTICIHKATTRDSFAIWEWRNDILTRQMSITPDEVTWENHTTWFHNSLENGDRYLYVCALEDESRVGMCRFDVDAMSNTAEVSINLNPVYRGKKYSQRVLNMASKLFQDEVVAEMVATIKHENLASIKCFLGCNYICTHEDASYKYYRSH